MKLATIFLCALVLAVSVSSYDLTPTQARKMRAQCLNECSADCPKNAINIMEGNCKSICKKDGGINLYDEACCKCATKVLGEPCFDCFGVCFLGNGYKSAYYLDDVEQ